MLFLKGFGTFLFWNPLLLPNSQFGEFLPWRLFAYLSLIVLHRKQLMDLPNMDRVFMDGTNCDVGLEADWKLCVNNWGKAWPLSDLGQTNPQLKGAVLTWIPAWLGTTEIKARMKKIISTINAEFLLKSNKWKG